jgi:hypothetical protein
LGLVPLLPTVGLDDRLVRLAAALSAIELLLFAIVAHLAGDFWQGILQQFGNLVVALGTTWYVVFTYGLLASAERSRRSSAEPFVTVQWEEQTEPSKNRAGDLTSAVSRVSAWLRQSDAEFLDRRSGDSRYINVVLQNQRLAKARSIQLSVSVTITPVTPVQLSGFSVEPVTVYWASGNAEALANEPLVVTVLDLGDMPLGFEASLAISELSYCAMDSDAPIREITGNLTHLVKGLREAGPKLQTIQGTPQ